MAALPLPSAPDHDASPRLRRMTGADLPVVLAQHVRCFPTNVVGRLGTRTLGRYYRTFIDAPHAAANVVEADGVILGFLVGVYDTRAHRSWVRQHHRASLAVALLTSFTANPVLAGRLVLRRVSAQLAQVARRVRRQQRGGAGGPVAEPGPVAVLSHILTVEGARRRGVGEMLLGEFRSECTRRGCRRISLATLEGPGGAGGFYAKRGWRLQGRRETIDHRWIELYDLDLASTGPAS